MSNKEPRIEEAIRQIRDFFNGSIVKKTEIFSERGSGNWNSILAALDVLEDTNSAIKSFQKYPSKEFERSPYLITYGILQTLVVQQDAVNHLKESLLGTDHEFFWKSEQHSKLRTIRNIRNETIGHPVKTRQKGMGSKYEADEITSCDIIRSSIKKNGFEYTLWKKSGTERKKINFQEIIDTQNERLSIELESILKKVRQQEKRHKMKFKGKKLSEILTKPSLYQIHLIYGAQWGDHLAWPSLDHYQNLYKKVVKGLEDRYGDFRESSSIPGTEEVIKKLDFIFAKLNFFRESSFENFELEIYVDALEKALNELQKHLVETDKRFEIK